MQHMILLFCLLSFPSGSPNLGPFELFAGTLLVMAVTPLLVAIEFLLPAGTRVGVSS